MESKLDGPPCKGASCSPKLCAMGVNVGPPAASLPAPGSSAGATPAKPQFYMRELPKTCVAFSSPEGKRIFGSAVAGGFMETYFRVSPQFRTQDEPAYCGLSTLVTALNALAVDPKRVWKGVWRWYAEEMLDCCAPLEEVKKKGITLDQFTCLAICNGLSVDTKRPQESSLEEFRSVIRSVCGSDATVLTVSYNRGTLGQTGSGHFSPIAGYDPATDKVLILDVARFKYPPHWVDVELLWEALFPKDSDTGLSRGFSVLSGTDVVRSSFFRSSTIGALASRFRLPDAPPLFDTAIDWVTSALASRAASGDSGASGDAAATAAPAAADRADRPTIEEDMRRMVRELGINAGECETSLPLNIVDEAHKRTVAELQKQVRRTPHYKVAVGMCDCPPADGKAVCCTTGDDSIDTLGRAEFTTVLYMAFLCLQEKLATRSAVDPAAVCKLDPVEFADLADELRSVTTHLDVIWSTKCSC